MPDLTPEQREKMGLAYHRWANTHERSAREADDVFDAGFAAGLSVGGGERARESQDKIIERVRAVLRPLGYAVGVHGSRARDLDLVAAPWVEDVERDVERITDALRDAGFDELGRGANASPHGRLGFALHGVPGSAKIQYVDLSILIPPSLVGEGQAELPLKREQSGEIPTYEPFPEGPPENWPTEYVSLADHEAELARVGQAERDRLREALEKIADPANWSSKKETRMGYEAKMALVSVKTLVEDWTRLRVGERSGDG